ncbi:LysE/ArgO family amino acid transporter [Neisseria yangbaofengii]|uniref:LysE/ArgO family amino acid transporter n=1 Tax=Neisseria yangbaofengii TaxID=2709396 RepID=UPI00210683C1|nr:LysE family transporter [Neisseria yangbaofengii]
MTYFINGFLISAGLIMAIGAQNALVLKQGLLRRHIWLVVLLCWLCDVVLMTLGVFGLSALLSGSPKLSGALALSGGLFLLAYGAVSAKRAWQGGNYLTVDTENHLPPSAFKIAATTLALTLLNPHVYIDTVVLIGGSAANLDQTAKQFFFGRCHQRIRLVV